MSPLTPGTAADLNSEARTQAIDRQWGKVEVRTSFPPEGCVAGSLQTVDFRFRAGSLGIDENGGLRFSFRFVSDMGRPQTVDPAAANYVSARTSGASTIALRFESKGNRRPFQPTLYVDVRDAALGPGDIVEVVFGDTSSGGPGWRQQTFVETPFPVLVAVDPLGTHDYQDLPRAGGWNVLPAGLDRYVLNVPSHVVAGETFRLRLKGEDVWGNPLESMADSVPATAPGLAIRHLLPVGDKVDTPTSDLDWSVGEGTLTRGMWSFPVSIASPGCYAIAVAGSTPSVGNPLVVRAPGDAMPHGQYHWCDLHGQSGETVGVGNVSDYFDFGRHYGFLDGSVHQGNDFQIGPATWQAIKQATDRAYEPGAFVTFHGYEWSGTTAIGGDHNVLFNEPNPPIYRSTGWLDGHPFEETAPLTALYAALVPHEAMTIAHVGGRPASFEESDPRVESLVELHSAWGTFEWVYQEAFRRGFKVGFVCNSDGHDCRPGASYPGAGIFGTLGGLTCVLADGRDRDAFWRALRARRTYGTTGQRIIVEADMNGRPIGAEVRAKQATVRVRVVGTAPLARLDLFRGGEIVQTFRPLTSGPGEAVSLRFGGGRVKGRARMVRWSGGVSLEGNAITSAALHGLHTPAYGIRSSDERGVRFECVTTGNLVNLLVHLAEGPVGSLVFDGGVTSHRVDLADLTREPRVLYQAPLDQRVEVSLCDPSQLSEVAEASFEIEVDHADEVPYFLRVTQLDEAKAWTSPFYLARP